jgi:hypothetical protein
MSETIARNEVVLLLGTPNRTEGSINNPDYREEHGLHFNEKWTYADLKDDPSGAPMRVVYWHRYDFKGTLIRRSADQEWVRDDTLVENAKRLPSRLATVEDHHGATERSTSYRPASHVRDEKDLGGYIEGAPDQQK